MSGRASKWIMLVLLPLLLALYLSYPPAGVELARYRVEKMTARTADEAKEHGVAVGAQYEIGRTKVSGRWLPFALGKHDTTSRLIERQEGGLTVEEETVTVPGRVKLGLDVAGGTELLYRLKPQEGERLEGKLSNTISILKKRIDPSNVKEFRIQAVEKDRILIQVPQATPTEVDQLKRRLEKMGKLEFKLAAPDADKYARLYQEAREGKTPDGYVRMYVDDNPEKPFFLVKKGDPEITGRYLSRVYPTQDRWGRPAVGFEFDVRGTRKFAQVTETNLGWQLAIILDGVLKSAPTIKTRIAGPGIIEGEFTQDQVNDTVNVLQAGSLPMDIELLQESTVGPQLGRDSIRRGLTSLVVAGLLVLGFMGFYYMRCGMVADGALILNMVFLVGVLAFLGAALTLPGMAGILLTVGMAVDANVLIFERIREESAAGKGVRVALRNGYERAFSTIVDANVTTLLTAIVLYAVGTGPVRGFAVTLSWGIMLSMFTALVVTRLAFETMIDREWLGEFKMRSVIHQPSIQFSRIRRPAYLMSAVVLVVGLGAFVARGGALYDIDFTGGSLVQISLAEPTPVSHVRALLADAGYPDAEVQGIHTAGATSEGLTDFGVRIKSMGKQRVEETLLPGIRTKLGAAGILAEGDSLKATEDGMAIELSLETAVSETDLRKALADGGDDYQTGEIVSILPPEDLLATDFAVRAYNVSSLVEPRDLWGSMLRALAWAGMEWQDYTIEQCAIDATDGDKATLKLVLDKPIQWQILTTELERRQFAAVEVQEAGEAGTEFILRAEREVLEQFQKELPAGAPLQSVPTARIDGETIRARLREPFSEQDIRSQFEKQGLADVWVIPMDVKAKRYRLTLSDKPIRRKMQSIFADLAHRGVEATFQNSRPAENAKGLLDVDMVLSQPITVDVVKNYIESAGIGPYAENIIEDEDSYDPGLRVSHLTLAMPESKAEQIQARIGEAFGQPRPVQRIVRIGRTVAAEMQTKALLAVVFASVIIVLYVAARFHAFKFGVAAVIALAHDILITVGLIALADWSGVMGDVKINLAMLAAFLTILGYSLNDTIVVFDRIRENMVNLGRKLVTAELIDMSINQTLSRTILTSLTTLAVVVVLYLIGGPALQGLALTLIIGVVVGTYSSMFIASPVLLDWNELKGFTSRFFGLVFLPVRLFFRGLTAPFRSGS